MTEFEPLVVTVLAVEYDQMKTDLKELAEDVIAYADQEWQDRDHYPHQQRKYDRDTETARRVLNMLEMKL